MSLEGRSQRINEELKAEGKVVTFSKESSFKLDQELELTLKIQQESRQKQRASRAYIADIESGRANLYSEKPFYEKIIDCIKNIF